MPDANENESLQQMMAAKEATIRQAQYPRTGASTLGRPQGYPADVANPTKGHAPLTVMLSDHVASALASVERIRSIIGDKHYALFDAPPPSAPSQLQAAERAEPSGFEAQARMALQVLNERLSDLEIATSALADRL